MRQVSITLSLPWTARPYVTSVYGRNAHDVAPLVRQSIQRYARKHGVAVVSVDYEVSWGAR